VEFTVVKGEITKIRFSMAAIKNVSTSAVEGFCGRGEADHLKVWKRFLKQSVDVRVVNHKTLESLVKAEPLTASESVRCYHTT